MVIGHIIRDWHMLLAFRHRYYYLVGGWGRGLKIGGWDRSVGGKVRLIFWWGSGEREVEGGGKLPRTGLSLLI